MAKERGIVILGVTSAIGRAVANEFAKRGAALIVASRDLDETQTIASDINVRYQVPVQVLPWDAADFDRHEAFFDQCVENLGDDLSGVVLCSGYMEEQERAQKEWDAARQTVDVNLTGAMSILNRFANYFEEREHGFICGVSSVAGDRGRQSNYIYGASKAGFTAYLEGLRNRLYHAGVHVVTVKPGFVDTKMTWGQVPFAASPESVGRDIVKAIEKKRNTVYVPWFWRYIMLIIRHVPEWQFKKMKM